MTKARASGLNKLGFKSQLGNVLAVWARCFPFLSLSFPIYRRGITPPAKPVLTLD